LKRVTLELGGKSPTVILPDADVGGAVKFALEVGLNNTGSACIAGTRILVPDNRAKEFQTAFKGAMEALKPGDPALQTGASSCSAAPLAAQERAAVFRDMSIVVARPPPEGQRSLAVCVLPHGAVVVPRRTSGSRP
jgi:acyl-CoA reductase-like NAD-dependent aldehyde dehydrogenase